MNKSKTMKGQEASKSQTIKDYLEELQSYLSRDSYLKFKESMCGYSKVGKEMGLGWGHGGGGGKEGWARRVDGRSEGGG